MRVQSVQDVARLGEDRFVQPAQPPVLGGELGTGFDRLDGRQALFKIALDGSGKRDLVFARPDVDVDGLIRIAWRRPRQRGVSWETPPVGGRMPRRRGFLITLTPRRC